MPLSSSLPLKTSEKSIKEKAAKKEKRTFTAMVCKKCEKKLATVICPDPWKKGARNTTESGGRRINENKALSAKNRFSPYSRKCRDCKSQVPQKDGLYCQSCAYKKGVCAMCGVQILDTKPYRQSAV